MRNANVILDSSDAARIGGYTRSIRRYLDNGTPVGIRFTKRDGSERLIIGHVESLKGTGSHSVVIVRMGNGTGYRSANVYNILQLWDASETGE